MKVLMVSLGCDKNLVDSEVMLGLLKEAGHEITNDEAEAEAVVINTCAFIRDAQEESINTILEYAGLKETASLKKLIVTGCLSERYKDEILSEIPEIDTIVGAANYDDIVKAIDTGEKKLLSDINYLSDKVGGRIVTTNAGMAYLKIAEGCNKMCTYCAIPYIRGHYRSIPMQELLKSAEALVANGINELVLVAQETTLYGTDIYGRKALPDLLRELCRIDDLKWIRIMYCYPEEITDELIEVIAKEDKICNYLDIPIQHSEDVVLKKMGRRTSKSELKGLISKLKNKIPGIAIRTTLISGFPGETKEIHEALLDFVDEMEFDRLGVFTFSSEEGTPAASFESQVDSDTAETRKNEIMALQQEISYDKNREFIGKVLEVHIEGYMPEEDAYVGRTYRDAPDVDGMVFIDSLYELMSGDFVNVKITDANEYDLIGEICDEFTE